MPFETSALKLWKSLAREERLLAARAFWQHPSEAAVGVAAREVVGVLRVRPQAFGKVPLEQRARTLAGLAHPPEALADALLLALHVAERRSLLTDFLDQIGVAHEHGMIAEDAALPALDPERARHALDALKVRGHAPAAIRTYWNALWLQDPERWAPLATLADELG